MIKLSPSNPSSDDDTSSSVIDSPCKIINESKTPYSDAVQSRKTAKHVKRPMNPFMVFSSKERRKVELAGKNHSEVSKMLGQKWKQLSEEERQPFIEEAERLQILHKQEFPDYKYKPKKKKKFLGECFQDPLTAAYFSAMSPPAKSQTPTCSTPVLSSGQSVLKRKLLSKEVVDNKLNLNESKPVDVEEKLINDNPQKKPKLVKRASMKKEFKVSPSNKHIWDNLRDVKITSLAIDKSNCEEFYASLDSDGVSKPSHHTKNALPLHVDGCLTSGSIAALACYRSDWSETFDYLTDKVLQSSKNICEEIKIISKKYKDLLEEELIAPEIVPPDLQIPDINKILGKNWKKPNFGLDFLP